MALEDFSTGQLQAELAKRERETREARAADLKSREIEVLCPSCGGAGTKFCNDMWAGYGEWRCLACNGTGRTKAIRAA